MQPLQFDGFGNSQRRGPESASRGTCHPGRHHPGMVGDIISERWAALSRNGWAASFRNHGRLAPESALLAHSVAFNPSRRGLLIEVKRTEMLRRGNACFCPNSEVEW